MELSKKISLIIAQLQFSFGKKKKKKYVELKAMEGEIKFWCERWNDAHRLSTFVW